MTIYQFPPDYILFAVASVAICFSSCLILILTIEVARGGHESRKEERELFSYLQMTQPAFEEFYARRKANETTLTTIP